MRRPRYKLQVSTFPFLAVLLCAMGSLLLFLFIMDRRAKIAAQHANHEAEEALQARKKRTKDEEDALQADWEKAKEKLHQALLLQEGQLETQAKGLIIDLDSAGKKLRLVQMQHQDIDEQAKAEAAKIAEIQIQIAGRRKGLLDADKMETMSKRELLAAAQELAELEIAFQQLLAVKEREKEVHSLVPYHGKRGDSRTPIYIECVRDGVIFHPDDKIVQGYDFTPGTIRIEVERRGGPLVPPRLSDAANKGAYVLFLVRPSGIGSYYLAQSALKGYRLDFGYELIDQNWELDFGGTRIVNNGPIGMPARRSEMPIDARQMTEPPLPIYGGGSGPPSGNFGPGPGSRQQTAGSQTGIGPPSTGFGSGSIGIPAPGGGVPGFGVGGGSGGPGVGPAFVPISRILPPVPIASTEGPGSGMPGYPGGAGPYPPNGTSSPGGGAGANPQAGPPNPGGGANGSGAAAPNGGGQNPAEGSGGAIGTPNANGQSGPSGAPNAQGSAGSGDGGPDILPPPALGAFGNSPKTSKKATPAPVTTAMLGNKDFVITISCYNDFVSVSPGGMSFRWSAANTKATDQAFAQAVANLIERRQASVRPGQPPYRPIVCFRVTPDGRPSCLHAYPLLEPLHLPMTRENVVE